MRKNWSHRVLALPDIDPSVALVQATRDEERHRAIVWQKREIEIPSIETGSAGAGAASSAGRNRVLMSLLLALFLLPNSTSAFSQVVVCRPLLSAKAVREVRPVSVRPLPWRWNATIVADTSFCATRSGNFEVDFVRVKEYSPDLQFTQTFRWTQNSFDISVQLWPDETILEYRIGFVAPCVCREAGELSDDPRVK